MAYTPKEPYVFKSGKRKGKVVELLMFTDYGFLSWLHNKISNKRKGVKKNQLEKHLEWILKQGETRKPKMDCPICGQNKIKLFSVIRGYNDFSMSAGYSCCENCKQKLKGYAAGKMIHLFEPKFSNIKNIAITKGDQKRISQTYRTIYKLPTRLTRKRAFEFFSE